MSEKEVFFHRLNDHVQYLRKIQQRLDGKGDFRGLDPKECTVGKWLYGEGPAEASAIGPEARAVFDRLFVPHQQFHDQSAKALAAQQAGDLAAQQRAIAEMTALSEMLIDILLELDRRTAQ